MSGLACGHECIGFQLHAILGMIRLAGALHGQTLNAAKFNNCQAIIGAYLA
jgi:hypothetical protein